MIYFSKQYNSPLDRAGNTLSAVSTLSLRGGSVLNRTQTYAYDNAGRVTDWTVTLGDKTASGSLTYGAFGSVASEKLGNNVERAYTYDCHGWVKGITTSIPNIHKFPDINIGSRFYSRVLDPDDIVLSPLYTDYTETVMYADGVSPRYDGTASSRITTLGGRYDYVFDNHDRLVRADYTPSADANADEDFSTVYAYNSVGAPVSVKRRGITDITKGDDDKITEVFGAMDCLSYDWDGMLLSSVSAEANGTDYLGRTGFSGSAKGGTSDFVWNAAGLLYSDTSRGITRTAYNWAGLPTQITFADGGYLRYTYNADGSVNSVTTYAMTGGRRPTRVSERTYCGDFVFEGDSMVMMNFGSGYFDGEGQPHYRHADWQGSVAMVTDRTGKVEQHNGYYPYGEPWREPSGQPYLFGGKERLRDNALNEYDFAARRLQSSLCLWTAPDPLATDYAPTSPYAYCAANPVKFTDPTGKDYKVTLENEMVTISAIIYCTQEAYQTALNATTLITEQSGNFEYSFKNSDGEMVNLPVNFEIEVNIAEQIYTLQNTSKADLSNINVALSKDDRFEKNGLVIQGENFYAKNTKSGESTHNLAKIGKSPNLTQTVAHEFGHMLGFLHSSFGLMTDNASHPSRSDKLDNQNIKESIQSAISGKQRYGQNYNNTGGYAGKGMFDNRSNFNIQEIITGVIKKIKK